MSNSYDVAIVGAGLSALSALQAGALGKRTIVLEHRSTAGGSLLPVLSEPEFAEVRDLVQAFHMPSEVTTRFDATVVGLLPAFRAGELHTLIVRQRQGTSQIQAQKVVIASGGLELTREHAAIPGTRPAGIITPVFAHQLLARGYLPGKQAIIYGDSRYACVTGRRLTSAGVEVISFAPAPTSGVYPEGPAELIEVQGFPRLKSVRLRNSKREFDQPADTLIYAAGMMANTHWLKGSGIDTTPGGAIQVDSQYRTNVPGIYAVGTVIAPSLDHTGSIAMGKEVAALIIGGDL